MINEVWKEKEMYEYMTHYNVLLNIGIYIMADMRL